MVDKIHIFQILFAVLSALYIIKRNNNNNRSEDLNSKRSYLQNRYPKLGDLNALSASEINFIYNYVNILDKSCESSLFDFLTAKNNSAVYKKIHRKVDLNALKW